ncbi:MAG: hypothetical protein K0B81_06735 [Candidatus Cloacimonetes bacterium]|nr:hypothetical protein [Candidatus Cloacimonadota bacterium]
MKILIILLSVLLFISCLFASEFDENLQQLLEEDGKAYVKPLVTAYGSNLNSGLYNTADVLKPSILRPIRFGFTFHTMLAMIPSSDKTFEASLVEGNTSTVFGDKGITGYPDGFNVSMLPLFVPQFRFGLPAGNELLVRYLPPLELQDYGDVTFWGVGLKHSIDQYIPLFPINLAVQGAYQSFSVGELVDITSFAVNAHASKSLLMWTLYGGLGYEETTLKAKYDHISDPDPVEFEVKGDNNFRMTAGFRYAILPFIHLNADYTISQYQVITLGLGLSL